MQQLWWEAPTSHLESARERMVPFPPPYLVRRLLGDGGRGVAQGRGWGRKGNRDSQPCGRHENATTDRWLLFLVEITLPKSTFL
jgi:hypothetical protein